LASGSGVTTVRFWDLATECPLYSCQAHKNWVLCVALSPDGVKFASADKNSTVSLFFLGNLFESLLNHFRLTKIIIWNPETGKQMIKPLTGHKQWVTYLCWQPLHLYVKLLLIFILK